MVNTKVCMSSNRSQRLKLKGSSVRPHYYLPLGTYNQENIFILFTDRDLPANSGQPTLLDVVDADKVYFAVAQVLAETNKTVFIANGASLLADTGFYEPCNHFDLDCRYIYGQYSFVLE